jgi:hypothetical protein
VSDQNFSAIRARLRYETIEDFIEGYSRFISAGGMFIPMKPSKLKPIGTTIRFQFLLGDGSTALLGEGLVLQVRSPDEHTPQAPVGMLIKFSKLSQESKALVDRIIEGKGESPKASNEQTFNDDMKTPTPPSFGAQENPALAEYLMRGGEPSEPEEAVAAEPEPAEEAALFEPEPEEEAALFEPEPEEEAAALFEPESEEEEPSFEPEPEEEEPSFEPEAEEDRTEESEAEEFALEPETAEAPLAELESPTAEAPQIAEEDEVKEDAAGPSMAGPKELGRTAGGLQILAFDKLGEDDLRDLESFSFDGADADIDDMFEGLFGGAGEASDAVDSLFGGVTSSTKPTTGDSMSSVEFELPSAEELEEDLEPEESNDSGGMFAAEDFGFAPTSDAASPSDDSGEIFTLSDMASSPEDEDGPQELGELHERSEQEWSMGESPQPSEVVLESEAYDEVSESEAEIAPPRPDVSTPAPPAHEIHSLLNTFEDDEESEMTLHIGLVEESRANPVKEEEADEDSLEALLASARREIEEKSTEEPREGGDIIDHLLGDDLPPPPMDGPVFSMPGAPKKKKGFLSKLFDKD